MKAGLYIYLLLLLSISINALLEDSIIDLIDEKDKDKLPLLMIVKFITFQYFTQMIFMAHFIQRKSYYQIIKNIQ